MSEEGNWKLNETHEVFMQAISDEISKSGLEGDTLDKFIEGLFKSSVLDCSKTTFDDLVSRGSEMIAEHREIEEGFRKRNVARWKEGLSHLRSIIEISHEASEAAAHGMQEHDKLGNSAKLYAIFNLHARALRTAREIVCLIENGFADGALARWRSLHEISTVANFLSVSDEEVSKRYLASRHCADHKAAVQYMEHHKNANLQPFDQSKLAKLKRHHDDTITKYGNEIKTDYGWAFGVLTNKKPTFYDIEKFCKLDHWRPRVKWASQEIHGGFTPHMIGLGVSENKTPTFLAGQSNSGMTDAGNMCAISLTIAATSLLLLEPTLDRIISVKILDLFCKEIGSKFLLGEARTK